MKIDLTRLFCLMFALGIAPAAKAQGILQARTQQGVPMADALELKSESLRIRIDSRYAMTTLQQAYHNQSTAALEGTFLLRTGGATVDGFAYWNGEKKIVGEVFEKMTAQQVYQQVSGLGRDPGLLEAVGEGAFSFRVFPITPGEDKRLEVRFGQLLPRVEKNVEYRVHLAGRGGDSDVVAEIRDENPIQNVRSATHELSVDSTQAAAGLVRVKVLRPLRPFSAELVLAYEVAEPPWHVSTVVHRDAGHDAYVAVRMAVPANLDRQQISAKDVTLVIDHSGSMSGEPLTQACRAAEAVVEHLRPADRVNVIMFDDRVDALYPQPQQVTDAVRRDALAFIGRIQAAGGTNIALALERALKAQIHDRQPDVVLFLTDGQSSPQEALAAARRDQGDARVFTIGLGTGVEKPLLSRLSASKRGRFTFIPSADAIADRVRRLFAEIESPVLLDVSIEASGVRLSSTYPRTLPDLVPGDELLVTARATGSGPMRISIHGLQRGTPVRFDAMAEMPAQAARPWVGRLWAKSRTDDLLEEIALAGEQDELKNEVINLALAYNLVTRYTSFLALPESEVTGAAREALDTARAHKRAIQAAHQDAVALSRTDMPPGDPILSIRAPQDAQQVTAYFPFGLVKDLSYDVRSERWQVRFLVPKEVADGRYTAKVLIVKKDGTVELAEVPFTIDSTAPEFSAEVSAADGGVEVLVSTAEPARQVTAALISDPRVRIELTDTGDHLVFKGFLPLPAGHHAVRIVVADKARNEADQQLTCEVKK